jgi:glycosyltransferase involved in cell wall biosynthesis
MRVLLDCRMAGWAGIGRYTTGLARALAARADVELTQVCAAGNTPPAEPGFLVRALTATAHPFSLRGALELGRLAREADPDLVHCAHFPTPLPVQMPLVVTLHDLIPMVVPGSMPSFAKRLAYRLWNTRATSAADSVVAPSRATALDLSRLFPSIEGRVVVIPEAADDFSSGPVGRLKDQLALLTAAPYVLAMGNTKPHKELPTLLNAFGILAPSFPDLRLLLVGPEPGGYLRSQLKSVPVEITERVIFTGQVDDAELRALYAGATVFVCPSRYEGFGLPALEAMALGAPVVCADAGSLPEVVGSAGLMFPAGEQGRLATAVAHVLRDPVLRHRLISAGRTHAAQFAWADTAAATVAVYTAVIHGRDLPYLGWAQDDTASDAARSDRP